MASFKINSDINLFGKLKLNTLDYDNIGSYLGLDATNNTILLPTPIKIISAGSLVNASDQNRNAAWFDYNWGGFGIGAGSVIHFSGLDGRYGTELFGNYNGGHSFYLRTRN